MSQKVLLIALAAIGAGLIAEGSPEVPLGETFEVPLDVAEKLTSQGLAEAWKPEAKPEKTIKARVLTDCQHGKCNEVASLPASVAKQAQADGLVDTSPAAVKYAESLAKAEPEA